jgi:uncharacterized membrane protein affecting hemolysin expression
MTFELIKEYWQFAVGVITAIGVVIRFIWNRQKKSQESTSMLYEQLEELKKKVILQVAADVARATELAEKQKIIEGLRLHCPECYDSFLNTQKHDSDKRSDPGNK